MEMQEIEVIIENSGEVNIKVKGIKGVDCLELTKPIEDALGPVQTRDHTDEYYEQPVYLSQNENMKEKQIFNP